MPRINRTFWMFALIAASACHTLTEPNALQDFQWMAVDNAAEITEGIDAAVFFGDISMLGQLKTPTLCFKPVADFTRDGSALTVRVTAQPTSGSTCPSTPGGFRYTALLRGLGSGSFTLHVIHAVNGTEAEYTENLEIP